MKHSRQRNRCANRGGVSLLYIERGLAASPIWGGTPIPGSGVLELKFRRALRSHRNLIGPHEEAWSAQGQGTIA
jgi:hypothetical protein